MLAQNLCIANTLLQISSYLYYTSFYIICKHSVIGLCLHNIPRAAEVPKYFAALGFYVDI